jgi:DNA-binding NarL/FixJ family response regulator
MIKIVIVTDRHQERDMIFSMLSTHKEFEISGLGNDAYDALKLSSKLRPDIIIIALEETEIAGPELIPLIKRKSPNSAIIFLSSRDDDENALKALSTGALGYLVKGSDMDKLAASVRSVYHGGYFINRAIIIRIFRMLSEMGKYRTVYRNAASAKKQKNKPIPSNINRMELQIMACIGKGHSNKEIAANLSLKPGTIRNYISAAMRKAGLKSRTQIAIFALKNGLTEPDGL